MERTEGMSGQEGKAEGIERVSRNHDEWLCAARDYAVWYAKRFGEVTSEDVRRRFEIPDDADARLLGPVFVHGIRGALKRIRWKESTSPQAHCRPIAVWAPV